MMFNGTFSTKVYARQRASTHLNSENSHSCLNYVFP